MAPPYGLLVECSVPAGPGQRAVGILTLLGERTASVVQLTIVQRATLVARALAAITAIPRTAAVTASAVTLKLQVAQLATAGQAPVFSALLIALVLTATTAIPRTLAFTAPAFTIPRGLGAHPVLVVQPAVTPALLIALVLTATIAIPRTRVALMDFVITMELLGVHPVTAARFPVAALHTRRAEATLSLAAAPASEGHPLQRRGEFRRS